VTDIVSLVVIGKMTPRHPPLYAKWPILDGPFLFLLLMAAGRLLETFAEPDICSPDCSRDLELPVVLLPCQWSAALVWSM
jgi:hypothetical protein